MRGGSWYSPAEDLRLSRRVSNPVSYFVDTVGFRVATDLTPVFSEESAPVQERDNGATPTAPVPQSTDGNKTQNGESAESLDQPDAGNAESDKNDSTEPSDTDETKGMDPGLERENESVNDADTRSDEDSTRNTRAARDGPEARVSASSLAFENDGTAEAELAFARIGFQYSYARSRPGLVESRLLEIPPVFQDTPVWCWLAVGEMIFRYYHVPNANPAGYYQCGVAGMFFGNACYFDCGQCVVTAGDVRRMDHMISEYANNVSDWSDLNLSISTRLTGTRISESRVRREIDSGRPIVIGISPSGYPYHQVSEHVALIVGYKGDKFIVNDPYPFRSGQNPYVQSGARQLRRGQYEVTYEKLTDRFQWKETIYGIECRGRHCNGGGPRRLQYGGRCKVGQFSCTSTSGTPLPVGSDCFCQDRRGRRIYGEVVR